MPHEEDFELYFRPSPKVDSQLALLNATSPNQDTFVGQLSRSNRGASRRATLQAAAPGSMRRWLTTRPAKQSCEIAQYRFCKRWFQSIPVIDVGPLVSGDQVFQLLHCLASCATPITLLHQLTTGMSLQNAVKAAQELHNACHDVGFFYVRVCAT